MRRRGATLVGTLLVAGVGLILALALAGAAISHLRLATTLDNRTVARQLAESVVNRAAGELLLDTDHGKAADLVWRWPPDSPESSHALLAFGEAAAADHGIPFSLNNFGQDAPADGSLGTVPPDAVQLVGVGRHRGVECTVEMLLHLPKPHVVSCSGEVVTRGPVLVAQSQSVDPLTGQLGALEDAGLLPGALASNSDADAAITLSDETHITGDVRAVGGIELNDATVEGEVRPNAPEAGIPEIDLSDFDPELQGKPGVQVLDGTPLGGETLSGYYVCRGDLQVTGDLDLSNAVLFVEGDLTISGGVRGKGAVIATETTTINDGVAISTDNQVALLSGGDVTITGYGKESTFAGLVYTEGDFTANRITLLGQFVANKEGGEGSRMSLTDADIVTIPGYSKLSMTVTSTTPPVTGTGSVHQSASPLTGDTHLYALTGGDLASLIQPYCADAGTYQDVLANVQGGGVVDNNFMIGKLKGPGGALAGGPGPQETLLTTQPAGTDWLSLDIPIPDDTVALVWRDQDGNFWGASFGWGAAGSEDSQTTEDTTPGEEITSEFLVDLKQFLSPADQMRVLMWRQL